jgi:hypothetical protein
MAGHDRGEAEIEPLQPFESFRIIRELGEVEIAELLFQNAITVENFLFWKNTKMPSGV